MERFFISICIASLSVVSPASAFVGKWELRPEPFTAATRFMSLPGYYRFKQHQKTGVWKSLEYDFTPVEEFVGCPGDDPSLGALEAEDKFKELLKQYPNRVLFVIRYTCQAPELGEGPMTDWNFGHCYNRFLDAIPEEELRRK